MSTASATAAPARRIWIGDRRRRDPALFARAVPVDLHRVDHAGAEGGLHAAVAQQPQVTYFPATPTLDNYVELFEQRAVRALFPQQHHHRDRQHAADAGGREPRRLRLRALPLRRAQLAPGRDAGRLHDPERRAAGAAAGDLPHLRAQQHPSRHDPGRGDAQRAVRAAADDQLLLDAAARARRGGAGRRLRPARHAVAHRAAAVAARASSPAACSPSS